MTPLQQALQAPLWLSHQAGDRYLMDGKGHWTLTYYPLLACGKTGKPYGEPRALVECPATFDGEEGIDIREVPLRYLAKKPISKG